MNYKQLQYDFTTDDAMTTKPKNKNRILVDVLDDDLISCFVITEQEATHDSPSYSFFSKLKSKMVFTLIWDRECVTNHPPIIIHVWINHSFEINCLWLTCKCYNNNVLNNCITLLAEKWSFFYGFKLKLVIHILNH